MQHIREILPKVLQSHGLKADADASLVIARANGWLKQRLGDGAEGISASALDAAVLTIEVDSPIAAQECYALHRDLVEYLRKEVPGVKVERVRIVRARCASS